MIIVIRILTCALIVFAAIGCSSTNSAQKSVNMISVISSTDVEFLSINGTTLDARSTTAVVVMPGHNQVIFRWPKYAEDFKIPSTYQITALIDGAEEYQIGVAAGSHLPCLRKIDKATKKVSATTVACAARRTS